jgi:hypothetical protein
MHQTVREFVSQPGFRQFVVPEERGLPMENGHSFLSKYGLCRLYHATDNGIDINSHKSFLNHTTEAELTTGRSQKQLIDEIPPLRFAAEAPKSSYLSWVDFNSPTSFAVSRNLRLYISETIKISGQFVNQNPGRSLLHFAVKPETRLLAYHRDSLDALDMVYMLLKAGASARTVCEENKYTMLTPFQAMFYGLNDFPPATTPLYMREDLTRMTKYFLEIGNQDPNERVRFRHGVYRGAFVYAGSTSALHVSSGALTALLLKHGAQVNAEDGLGRRPLDLIVQVFNMIFRGRVSLSANDYKDDSRAGEAYETVTQLLAAGGHFARSTVGEDAIRSPDGKRLLCALEYFIEVVELAGYDGSPIRSEFLRLKEEEATSNPQRQPLAEFDSGGIQNPSQRRTADPERPLKRHRSP